MIKVDLITGFLGAGKTERVRKYASYQVSKGGKIGIIENDFGAVNIDMLLLADLEGENCETEQIVGSQVVSDWKRRFRAKLVSMAMRGFDRIIVEPSGIFDVYEFFDVLYEEPVSRFYEPGNVILVLDAAHPFAASLHEEYLVVSQAAYAGCIVFSHLEECSMEQVEKKIEELNLLMEKYKCSRRLHLGDSALITEKGCMLSEKALEEMSSCGSVNESYEKLWFSQEDIFQSVVLLDLSLNEKKLIDKIKTVMKDPSFGQVIRAKGFFEYENSDQKTGWKMVNAAENHIQISSVSAGQKVVILVGQDLEEEKLKAYFAKSE